MPGQLLDWAYVQARPTSGHRLAHGLDGCAVLDHGDDKGAGRYSLYVKCPQHGHEGPEVDVARGHPAAAFQGGWDGVAVVTL